ncbi:substrate-binding domain-containing protein [Nocardia sp. R7R-8]|uniref:substrate-binding domain-containing protein n=1 Tax=Nocardia sp. R7R-8 TaxID=3459304 RepID=UPI00403E1567
MRKLAVAAVLSMLVLSGCSQAGSSNLKASESEVNAGLDQAKANLENLISGANSTPPGAGGPAPVVGKNVWMINIGVQSAGSSRWARGFSEAAELMGWHTTVYDGEYTASKWVEGLQQAAAAGADGIVLAAIDCASVKAPLEQAKKAGIKVVGLSSADCNEVDQGAASLFDGTVQYAVGGLKDFSESLGAAQADWITVATGGEGKIINMTYSESVQNNWQDQGFTAELTKVCPNCEIVKGIDIVTTDLYGTAVREKLEQAFLTRPNANGLVVPFDDVMTTSGGSGAIPASAKNTVKVVATGGASAAAFEQVRSGKGLDAIAGSSFEWESWAAVDSMNRLFAGQPVVSSGQGTLLIEKGHNDESTTGSYNSPIDFRAVYRKAWGRG